MVAAIVFIGFISWCVAQWVLLDYRIEIDQDQRERNKNLDHRFNNHNARISQQFRAIDNVRNKYKALELAVAKPQKVITIWRDGGRVKFKKKTEKKDEAPPLPINSPSRDEALNAAETLDVKPGEFKTYKVSEGKENVQPAQ